MTRLSNNLYAGFILSQNDNIVFAGKLIVEIEPKLFFLISRLPVPVSYMTIGHFVYFFFRVDIYIFMMGK